MKLRELTALAFATVLFSAAQAQQLGDGQIPEDPFRNFILPPSAPMRFLFSERGRVLLRSARNSESRTRILQERATAAAFDRSTQMLPQATNCGAPSGAKFNLELPSLALPQNEESVDFLPNRAGPNVDLVVAGANDFRGFFGFGNSTTGYYVHRSNIDCSVTFEGGLPSVSDPLTAGKVLNGNGDPVVAADPERDAFFMADLHFDTVDFSGSSGIGVFRTTGGNLLNPTSCSDGTHDAAQAALCWPTHTLVYPVSMNAAFQDKPHLAVDERASGTGAGNVYVAGTLLDFSNNFAVSLWLVACTNDLSACSPPVVVGEPGSGFVFPITTENRFPHLSVRPDGTLTITFAKVILDQRSFTYVDEISYVSCSTINAPNSPVCSAPRVVAAEPQALGFFSFAPEEFLILTYPKHDHRVDANGIETYVIWDRCKVALVFGGQVCPATEVVLASSSDNGMTWSTPQKVNQIDDSDFFSWIKTDRSTGIVNITYYTVRKDPVFKRRLQVAWQKLLPGANEPKLAGPAHLITNMTDDPTADLFVHGFLGDYIGIASRGSGSTGHSRVYFNYTFNTTQGNYNGVLAPNQDNYLNRTDY